MKIIKVIGGSSQLEVGKVYVVGEDQRTYKDDWQHQFRWFMEDNDYPAMNNTTVYLNKADYLVLASGTSESETLSGVFYNSDLMSVLREIKDAINVGNGGSYDYEVQQAQREQAQAAKDGANFQQDQMMMMQKMEEFFRLMSENMVNDRMEKVDRETQEQQDRLAREIKITPYSEEQKIGYYYRELSRVKMNVVYKKVS